MPWQTSKRTWTATNPITGVTETQVATTLPKLPPSDLLPDGKARDLAAQIEKLDAERRRLESEAAALVADRPKLVKEYEEALARAAIDGTAPPRTNPVEKLDQKVAALREQARILQNAVDIPLAELGSEVNRLQAKAIADARAEVSELVDRLAASFDDDFAADVERLGLVSGYLRWCQSVGPNTAPNFGGTVEADLVRAVATVGKALADIASNAGVARPRKERANV